MNDVNVLIVDDSPFQITLIREMLESNGFNVAGEAQSLEEVIEAVKTKEIDLVTMDMTIPGTDGFECTREIHKINDKIKVIIVSSMMDEELVRKAKKLKISGYLQKPVDQEDLTLLIKRVAADEELYIELRDMFSDIFKESILDIFNKLTKTVPTFSSEGNENVDIHSKGISVVMGIIGKYTGRVIMDMDYKTAEKLAIVLLRRNPKNDDETYNVVSEIANMFVGNACSMINKKDKVFGLRVAPPTTFHGESINISKAELEDNYNAVIESEFGNLSINVGIKRGDGEWMSII